MRPARGRPYLLKAAYGLAWVLRKDSPDRSRDRCSVRGGDQPRYARWRPCGGENGAAASGGGALNRGWEGRSGESGGSGSVSGGNRGEVERGAAQCCSATVVPIQPRTCACTSRRF